MGLFEKELLKRLDSYIAEGLVDAESGKRLGAALEAKIRGETRAARNMLHILGIVLIFTACSVWTYHNWEHLGERVRETLSFLPLALSAALGIFALKRNLPQLWKETAAILNIAGVWVMIAGIGHLYNIQADDSRFYISVICLSIPAVPIFRSGAAAAALCAINILYMAKCPGSEFIIGVAVYAALAAFAFGQAGGGNILRKAGLLFACLASSASISCTATRGVLSVILISGFSGVFLAAAASKSFSKNGIFRNPCALAGFLLLLFLMSPGSSRAMITALSAADSGGDFAFQPAFWTLCALYAFALFRAFRNPRRESALLGLSAVFPAFATAVFAKNFWLLTAVLNGTIFAASAAFLIAGILRKNRAISNFGAVMILFQCASRIFDSQTDTGIRAAAIAAAGAFLIIFNIFLNRGKSREN